MGSSSPSFVSMLLSIRLNSLVKSFIKIQSMRSHVYTEEKKPSTRNLSPKRNSRRAHEVLQPRAVLFSVYCTVPTNLSQ